MGLWQTLARAPKSVASARTASLACPIQQASWSSKPMTVSVVRHFMCCPALPIVGPIAHDRRRTAAIATASAERPQHKGSKLAPLAMPKRSGPTGAVLVQRRHQEAVRHPWLATEGRPSLPLLLGPCCTSLQDPRGGWVREVLLGPRTLCVPSSAQRPASLGAAAADTPIAPSRARLCRGCGHLCLLQHPLPAPQPPQTHLACWWKLAQREGRPLMSPRPM